MSDEATRADMPHMLGESSPNVRRFETGSVRDTVIGKPRLDLNSPVADRAEGYVNAYGSAKYAARNWEKGQPLVEGPASSLRRHLDAWLMGQDIDPESGLPHLWLVRWNASALVHLSERVKAGELPDTLDDRPLKHSVLGSDLVMPTETTKLLSERKNAPSAAPSATPASDSLWDRRKECYARGNWWCDAVGRCYTDEEEHMTFHPWTRFTVR